MAKAPVNFRVERDKLEKYRAKASLEGKTMTDVIVTLLDDWLNKDVNMQNQLLMTASRQMSESVRCRNEILIASEKIQSLVYSLFCAFPEKFEKEFLDIAKLPDGDTYTKAQTRQRRADYLMRLWNKKRVSAKKVARAEMAGILDEMNGEQ